MSDPVDASPEDVERMTQLVGMLYRNLAFTAADPNGQEIVALAKRLPEILVVRLRESMLGQLDHIDEALGQEGCVCDPGSVLRDMAIDLRAQADSIDEGEPAAHGRKAKLYGIAAKLDGAYADFEMLAEMMQNHAMMSKAKAMMDKQEKAVEIHAPVAAPKASSTN